MVNYEREKKENSSGRLIRGARLGLSYVAWRKFVGRSRGKDFCKLTHVKGAGDVFTSIQPAWGDSFWDDTRRDKTNLG